MTEVFVVSGVGAEGIIGAGATAAAAAAAVAATIAAPFFDDGVKGAAAALRLGLKAGEAAEMTELLGIKGAASWLGVVDAVLGTKGAAT